jgi:hypothetical protein
VAGRDLLHAGAEQHHQVGRFEAGGRREYLTEQRYDQMAPALDPIRRAVLALGLPLRSVEVEFGIGDLRPAHEGGVVAVAGRDLLHAGAEQHHQVGRNLFMASEDGQPLSALGRHYLAGLLHHARAAAVRCEGIGDLRPAHEGGVVAVAGRDLLHAGAEQHHQALDPIRRAVLALGLPLRSVEVEFGPSQCEFTFAPVRYW